MDTLATAILLPRNGSFPNNPRLPLLIYRKAISAPNTKQVELLLKKNHWKRIWVNGIYSYHHFHSNTHEVLVICSGECHVQFGGEPGELVAVEAGDVIIIPAGVSHKNIDSSTDFICVGAYPFDVQYDMRYGNEKNSSIEVLIEAIPIPENDPIYGKQGPLHEYWK